MNRPQYLFLQSDLRATIENLREKLKSEISGLSHEQLRSDDISKACEHFVAKFTIAPIELHEDGLELMDPREIETEEVDHGMRYRRKSLEFRFELHFSGDVELLKCKPSSFNLNPPQGEIVANRIILILIRDSREGSAVKTSVNDWLSGIKLYIAWQAPDIDQWNNVLPALVSQHVSARRGALVADKKLISDLGFRIRQRGNPAASYVFPVHQKRVVPQLPGVQSGPLAEVEPILEMTVYEEILDTLAGMSVTMERCPSAFSNLDEESLRMQFLIPLNGKFQGQTSGETFNAAGKTDILIKFEDRIVFVAECKFWKGAQSLSDAIDQLLSYLTWRETKAAILLFNRNRDFSAVLAQIPNVIGKHPQFVRKEAYEKSTGFRFVVRHPNDASRNLIVTILAFDVPQSS